MLLFALIGFDVHVGRWSAETTLYGKNVQYLLYSMYIMGGKSNVKQKAAECSIILLFE